MIACALDYVEFQINLRCSASTPLLN